MLHGGKVCHPVGRKAHTLDDKFLWLGDKTDRLFKHRLCCHPMSSARDWDSVVITRSQRHIRLTDGFSAANYLQVNKCIK